MISEIFLTSGLLIATTLSAFKPSLVTKRLFISILMGALIMLCLHTDYGVMFQATTPWAVTTGLLPLKAALLIITAYLMAHFNKNTTTEAFVITGLITLGSMVMLSSQHFLLLYLGLEIQSLGFCVLIAVNRSKNSVKAALTYFILSGLASGFFLYGVSLLYGVAGTLDFVSLALQISSTTNHFALSCGFILILLALLFKVGLAPFHVWLMDVYEHSPPATLSLLTTLSKFSGFVVLAVLIQWFFMDIYFVRTYLLPIIAGLCLLIGAFGALYQTNLYRLIAYSSINHGGFILSGLQIPYVVGHGDALLYLGIYTLTTLFLMSILLQNTHTTKRPFYTLTHLAGLSQTQPLVAFTIGCVFLSLAGLPPFAGFLAKYGILRQLIDNHHYTLAIVAVFSTVIGLFYTLRILKTMYFDKPNTFNAHAITGSSSVCLYLYLAILIFFTLVYSPLSQLAHTYAQNLLF